MKYQVMATVDTNDGDYVTRNSVIDENELETLRFVCEKIKGFEDYETVDTGKYGHYLSDGREVFGIVPEGVERTRPDKNRHSSNWPNGECHRSDLGELRPEEIYDLSETDVQFMEEEILPYCEYGFHTVESIEIAPYQETERLL